MTEAPKYWPKQAYYEGKGADFAAMPWWRERYPNFKPSELTSYNDELLILVASLDALQAMRTEFGQPFIVNSAYRNLVHNADVNGSPGSMHPRGHAKDISLHNGIALGEPGFQAYDERELERLARKHGFNGIGRYRRDFSNPAEPRYGFIHMDMRERAATWGRWS